ncbi:MAG: hypothetical protein HHJ12_09090 [Glaciimonas sp.]|nr:hypothetical protein [Glaciimonas sp.]
MRLFKTCRFNLEMQPNHSLFEGSIILPPSVLSALLVASKVISPIKTGALADVITTRNAALREKNMDASILLPINPSALDKVMELAKTITLDNLPGMPASGIHTRQWYSGFLSEIESFCASSGLRIETGFRSTTRRINYSRHRLTDSRMAGWPPAKSITTVFSMSTSWRPAVIR